MDQQLIDFIENYHSLAQYRNVSETNPIRFEIQPHRNNPNKIFVVVVSFLEPTFSQLPYNVIWLPCDSDHPAYQKALKRTSHADSGYYKNTWEEIENYADLWIPDQYYQAVVEDPRLHGITTSSEPIGPATRTEHGTVSLATDEPESRAVSIEDPRNSDPRYPIFHTHPDYPRTKIKIDSTNYALVNTSEPPQQGMLLFIVGQSSENANEFIAKWKFPTEDDYAVVDASLVGIVISGPTQINEQTDADYVVTAYYADGRTAIITPDSFTSSNQVAASINPAGELSAGNVQNNTQVVLDASYTEDGITMEDNHTVQVIASAEIIGLAIVGDNSVAEGTDSQYVVRATLSDNSTIDVTADSISVDNTEYATIDDSALLSAQSVDGGDKSVEISATYTYDGTEMTATKSVTIEDTDALISSIEIVGPNTLGEGEQATYTFRLVYSDGSEVYPATPTSFTQSSNAYSTLDDQAYQLTAGTLEQDRSVRLTAEFTEYGNTVTANLDVDLVNNPPAPVSAQILGANSIEEQTSANYTLRVTFDNASTQDYTAGADWSISVGDTYAGITGSGVLTANDIDSDQTVTIASTIDIQGNTLNATKDVDITIQNVELTSLTVATASGSVDFSEGQTVSMEYTAGYSDGSTKDVKADVNLVPSFINNAYGSTFTGANAKDVELGQVVGNKSITVKGTYEEGGVTKTDTIILNIQDADVTPRWGIAPQVAWKADYETPEFYDQLTNPLTGTDGEEITVALDGSTQYGYILYPKAWGFIYIRDSANTPGGWDFARISQNDADFNTPYYEATIGGTDYYVYRTDSSYTGSKTFNLTYGATGQYSYEP